MRPETLDFDTFCRAEYGAVYAAARSFAHDEELARDVTQEAFARAYARWRRLGRHPWAGGWVMTTALNLCRRELRRRPSPAPARSGAQPAPDIRLDVAAALRELPLRQRQAVVLHYIGDLPVSAVAELMKTSEGTVKAHLSRGREALGARLTPSEGGAT